MTYGPVFLRWLLTKVAYTSYTSVHGESMDRLNERIRETTIETLKEGGQLSQKELQNNIPSAWVALYITDTFPRSEILLYSSLHQFAKSRAHNNITREIL